MSVEIVSNARVSEYLPLVTRRHGQFYDFLHLLSLTGPSFETHAALFNGDTALVFEIRACELRRVKMSMLDVDALEAGELEPRRRVAHDFSNSFATHWPRLTSS